MRISGVMLLVAGTEGKPLSSPFPSSPRSKMSQNAWEPAWCFSICFSYISKQSPKGVRSTPSKVAKCLAVPAWPCSATSQSDPNITATPPQPQRSTWPRTGEWSDHNHSGELWPQIWALWSVGIIVRSRSLGSVHTRTGDKEIRRDWALITDGEFPAHLSNMAPLLGSFVSSSFIYSFINKLFNIYWAPSIGQTQHWVLVIQGWARHPRSLASWRGRLGTPVRWHLKIQGLIFCLPRAEMFSPALVGSQAFVHHNFSVIKSPLHWRPGAKPPSP